MGAAGATRNLVFATFAFAVAFVGWSLIAPLAKRFHYTKPPTILDAPVRYEWAALDIPDPETPVGARGVGEPPVGAGCAAVLNAIAAAVGDEVFRRMPVQPDIILAALEAGRPAHEPLTANI